MFKNIGKKIKVLAVVFCVLGIIGSLIAGGTMLDGWRTQAIGAAIMIGGSLLSWISSFVLYGFGELVDNSAIIAKKLSEGTTSDSAPQSAGTQNTAVQNTAGEFANCKSCGAVLRTDMMYRGTDGSFLCKECYDKGIR